MFAICSVDPGCLLNHTASNIIKEMNNSSKQTEIPNWTDEMDEFLTPFSGAYMFKGGGDRALNCHSRSLNFTLDIELRLKKSLRTMIDFPKNKVCPPPNNF